MLNCSGSMVNTDCIDKLQLKWTIGITAVVVKVLICKISCFKVWFARLISTLALWKHFLKWKQRTSYTVGIVALGFWSWLSSHSLSLKKKKSSLFLTGTRLWGETWPNQSQSLNCLNHSPENVKWSSNPLVFTHYRLCDSRYLGFIRIGISNN